MAGQPASPRVLLFIGGAMGADPSPDPEAIVIAADSGYEHAIASGIAVDVLVGDLDSIAPPALAHAEQSHIRIVRHRPDKDATDTELALDMAMELSATAIDMYGGEGGDLSHLLGVASIIAADKFADTAIRWHTAKGEVSVVRRGRPLTESVAVGSHVALVPVTDVTGVTTTGLRWPLNDENLIRGTSRGLSNQSKETAITVTTESGVLLVNVEGPST